MEVFRRLVLEQQPPPARFQASEMCIRLLEELPPPASMETDKGAQGPGKSRQTKNVTAAAKRKHLPDGAAPDAKRSKRICEFKTTGTCDIPNCRAPHLASMMKPGSNTASVVCKFYRSGACTVEDCGFAHDLSLEACVYFHFRGGCKNSACPFSHDPLTDFQRAQYDKNCASFQEKVYSRDYALIIIRRKSVVKQISWPFLFPCTRMSQRSRCHLNSRKKNCRSGKAKKLPIVAMLIYLRNLLGPLVRSSFQIQRKTFFE